MIHFNPSRILIPVDFSETSLLAIKHGAFIAQFTKADLSLLHVVNIPYISQDLFLPTVNLEDQSNMERKAMQKLLELCQDIKNEYGVNTESIIKVGSPNREICDVAKEVKASLIIMGTHGYSPIQEILIGSTALKVITNAPCPTMAMSSTASHKGYNNILMPFDTTATSRHKVNFTLEFAKKFNATVHSVALLDDEDDRGAMEVILKQVDDLAKEKGVKTTSEILSNVKNRATATVTAAEQKGADLLVIMTDQDAELSGLFLGPYSQQILHLSKVPVIAIRPADLYADPDGSLLPGTSGS
ncbi:MAG: universal stress protein [Bacteroidia bacterium]|nr:universal stress protein [Bacteroidia bacterium]